MSGTTAVTSRSQSQIAHIKEDVIDKLPDLLEKSEALLDLLIPAEVTTKSVARITKELRTPGSKLTQILASSENEFQIPRKDFGTDEYINNNFVLRKFFGSDAPGDDFRRPDAINHLANLATLVKNFLVAQWESPKTLPILETLDTCFPQSFASRFSENIHNGGTALLEETFHIGLEIRTQFVIGELAARKEDDDFVPETILAAAFYSMQTPQVASSDFFEDAMNNQNLRNILGNITSNSEEQVVTIQQRILDIFESFNGELARAAGDPIDFDHLEKFYSWPKFLTQLLQWAQQRYREISKSITEQGGVEAIVENIKGLIREMEETQSDIASQQDFSVPNAQKLQSSAPVIHNGSKQR
jgi:hypothetical protein